jgi:hypothetical protein
MGQKFTIAAGPGQSSQSRIRVPRDSWLYLLSQNRDFPKLYGQVPVFISPRNMVVQLHPQVLGSLYVASYDSQDYGGSIRTRLENVYIVACSLFARKTTCPQLFPSSDFFTIDYLHGCYLAMSLPLLTDFVGTAKPQ